MRTLLSLLAISALTALACSSPTAPNLCAGSGAAVVITASDDYRFTPDSVTITVGQSVCWQNTGKLHHTVTNVPLGYHFGADLPSGQTFVYQSAFGGNLPYQCTIHAGMTGTVIVNCKPGQSSC